MLGSSIRLNQLTLPLLGRRFHCVQNTPLHLLMPLVSSAALRFPLHPAGLITSILAFPFCPGWHTVSISLWAWVTVVTILTELFFCSHHFHVGPHLFLLKAAILITVSDLSLDVLFCCVLAARVLTWPLVGQQQAVETRLQVHLEMQWQEIPTCLLGTSETYGKRVYHPRLLSFPTLCSRCLLVTSCIRRKRSKPQDATTSLLGWHSMLRMAPANPL